MEFLLRKLNWSDHTAWCQECKRPSVHFSPAKTFLFFEMMPANQSTWNLNHYHLMQFVIKKITIKIHSRKITFAQSSSVYFNFNMVKIYSKNVKVIILKKYVSELCKLKMGFSILRDSGICAMNNFEFWWQISGLLFVVKNKQQITRERFGAKILNCSWHRYHYRIS